MGGRGGYGEDIAAIHAAGFTAPAAAAARELLGGYARAGSFPGVTAFAARRR